MGAASYELIVVNIQESFEAEKVHLDKQCV